MLRAIVLGAATLLAGAGAVAAPAQTTTPSRRTIWDGVYTAEQADRGLLAIGGKCAACHTMAEWTADVFLERWAGRPLLVLYDTTRLTMPVEAPGTLTRQEYADIVAAILRLNKAAAGKTPLPSDIEGLKQIDVTPRPDRQRPSSAQRDAGVILRMRSSPGIGGRRVS